MGDWASHDILSDAVNSYPGIGIRFVRRRGRLRWSSFLTGFSSEAHLGGFGTLLQVSWTLQADNFLQLGYFRNFPVVQGDHVQQHPHPHSLHWVPLTLLAAVLARATI